MVSRLCGLGLQMAQDEVIAARYKRIASVIRGIILLEPCVDPTLSTPSSRFFTEGPVWRVARRPEPGVTTSVSFGCGSNNSPASDRGGIPEAERRVQGRRIPTRAHVVNPVDPLRDEGIALATSLVDAGCIAEMHMFAGTFHGSLSMPGSVTWGEIQLLIDRFVKENSVAR